MPETLSVTAHYVLRPNDAFTAYRRMPVVAFTADHKPIAADGVVGYRSDEALMQPDGRVLVLGALLVADAAAWLGYFRDSLASKPTRVIVPLPQMKGPTDGR